MLHPSQRLCPNLRPVYPCIQLIVHEPAYGNVVAADQIQSMFDLLRRVVWACRRGGEDALDCLGEDEVCGLVVADELSG